MRFYEMKAYARAMLRRAGLARRQKPDQTVQLLAKYDVDVVFDVGANNGQYGRQLIAMGWTHPIISFEPLSSAMIKLSANAQHYPQWTVENLALGAQDGEAKIHVSGNSQSSSFRDILPAHVEAAPASAYVGEETVKVARLDSIIDRYCDDDSRCFLKLDVQGFERDVLEGAEDSLSRCVGLQVEMAVTPLYDGETLLPDMIQHLDRLGYSLMSLGGVFADGKTGQVVQMEGVFYRTAEVQRLRNAA